MQVSLIGGRHPSMQPVRQAACRSLAPAMGHPQPGHALQHAEGTESTTRRPI